VLLVATGPKLKLDGVTVSAPDATAVTDKGTARVAFVAFEVTVRFPLSAPAVLGAQVILMLVLWFGASVVGMLIAGILKPVPDTIALLMVTLEPPEFVMVAILFWVVPTARVPKATGVELASDPGELTVAASGMLRVGFEAVLMMLTPPTPAAVVSGTNVTEKFAVWPAVSVIGRTGAVKVYPAPVIPA
jgi:hypothetical protein